MSESIIGTGQSTFKRQAVASDGDELLGLKDGQTSNFSMAVVAAYVQSTMASYLQTQIATQVAAAIAAIKPTAPAGSIRSDTIAITSDSITITSDAI